MSSPSFALPALTSLCAPVNATTSAKIDQSIFACGFHAAKCGAESTVVDQCNPVFLLRSLCAEPETRFSSALACGQVVSYCTASGSDSACSAALPGVASSSTLSLLAPVCDSFPPPTECNGCLALTPALQNATIGDCNIGALYTALCNSAGGNAMCTGYSGYCKAFAPMCPASTPNTPVTPPTTSKPSPAMCASMPGMAGCSGTTQTMGLMYLHTGINDLVLFQTFIPANNLQYAGALTFAFGLPILAAWIGHLRKTVVEARKSLVKRVKTILNDPSVPAISNPPGVGADANDDSKIFIELARFDNESPEASTSAPPASTTTNTNKKLMANLITKQRFRYNHARSSSLLELFLLRVFAVKDPSFVIHQVFKFWLKSTEVLLDYLVMLIVMQFNVGYLVVTCLGYATANLLFDNVEKEIGADDCCNGVNEN
ncbi:UNVERIFIED_CONTAM: hypothetical protein HDU68_007919 [Siphonaria sp. JEL0065]|nr:hypothetical protein HDU68_007919 [Siphonaria sp. JEL0065]